jgi:hypothetical protein
MFAALHRSFQRLDMLPDGSPVLKVAYLFRLYRHASNGPAEIGNGLDERRPRNAER